MVVPFANLKAQYKPLRRKVRKALDRVCDAQAFILGEEVEAFEREFADYCHVRHAIGVSSGSDALLAALMVLDIQPGDEVITTPFTFFATAGVIHRMGARPIFADINPTSFNIDPCDVKKKITDKTKAIIAVHLYGQCADMEGLAEVCGDIPIIEDAAQSVGAEATIDGQSRRTGAIGRMATFSFFPAKNLGCFGDGGAITTDDDDLAQRLYRLRTHGQSRRYFHDEVGGNFRLDALQAAVLRIKLEHLDGWTAARQLNANSYAEKLHYSGILTPDGLITLPGALQPRHVWNQYVIQVADGKRDAVLEGLREHGVGCAVYYPIPLHMQPCFAYLNQNTPGTCPVAEAASLEVLALPIVPEITEEQHDEVVSTLIAVVKRLQNFS